MGAGESEHSSGDEHTNPNCGADGADGADDVDNNMPPASKVLVVDDERKLVELVKGYLLAEGLEV